MAEVQRAAPEPWLDYALVRSLSETFDLAAARRAAREGRIPIAVVGALLACALTVAAIIGFSLGGHRHDMGLLVGVLLLLAFAFCLILDLDRSVTGTVQVGEKPLRRAVADVEAAASTKPPPRR